MPHSESQSETRDPSQRSDIPAGLVGNGKSLVSIETGASVSVSGAGDDVKHPTKDMLSSGKADIPVYDGENSRILSSSGCRRGTGSNCAEKTGENSSAEGANGDSRSNSNNKDRPDNTNNTKHNNLGTDMAKKICYMQTKGPPASEQVNLRLGYPAPEDLPIDAMRKAMAAKMEEDDPEFFMYGVAPGFLEFRQQLSGFLTEHYGYDVEADHLMAVNGSAGGLDLICRMCTEPGDEVFIENPTYFLASPTFKDYYLRPIAVDMEVDGVDLNIFEQLLKKHRPKLFYTIPVAHNPTGRTTSAAKRKRLVELAVKHNFKIVADEVYHLLCFEGKDVPPSFSFFDSKEKPSVLSLGSFSKILAPALRLGWIQAHPSLLEPLLQCGMIESGGCLNPVICGMVEKAIGLGFLKENVLQSRRALQHRCNTLKRALQTYFPPESISFEDPVGGYFLIAKLPKDIHSLELLCEAETHHRVYFLAGSHFGKGYDAYIRLSFSYYTPIDIETGVKRLAAAVKSLLHKKQQQQCSSNSTAAAAPT